MNWLRGSRVRSVVVVVTLVGGGVGQAGAPAVAGLDDPAWETSRRCPSPGVWDESLRACFDAGFGVPAAPQVRQVSKTALRLSWKRVKGADGYKVYRGGKNAGDLLAKYRPAKVLVSGKARAWTARGLKPGSAVSFVVRAFHVVKGERLWSGPTYWVNALVAKPKGDWTNADQIKLDTSNGRDKVSMGFGGQRATGGTPRVGNLKKTETTKYVFDKRMRYKQISGFDVVKLVVGGHASRALGRVGTAKIWMIAHNGLRRLMTVEVADYTMPRAFYPSKDLWGGEYHVKLFLDEFRVQAGQIAHYLTHPATAPSGYGWVGLSDDGRLVGSFMDDSALAPRIQAVIRYVLENYPYEITIEVVSMGVMFYLTREIDGKPLEIAVRYDPSGVLGGTIASHWSIWKDADPTY